MITNDTIIALATPPGTGAIAVIRISGPESISITTNQFVAKNQQKLSNQRSHTLHLGHIVDKKRIIDEVLVSIFRDSKSYTGEPVVEISCHGSSYIQQEILSLFLQKGCRMANPGEFTLRAFLNGKMDLSQAEAVADLIASDSKASHQLAMQQMRGGFSNEIKQLREELLNFASLIELELDFAEEDVEFANREQFQQLISKITATLKNLIDSFAVGNVIKNGIPVAIVGAPNVGKSTLLNALLNEERAIVSDIAGTTRDTIEDELNIDGINFRFIDTAGIRETTDTIEGLGIQKTYEKILKAQVILYLVNTTDLQNETSKIIEIKTEINQLKNKHPQKPLIVVVNKVDILSNKIKEQLETELGNQSEFDLQLLSAKNKVGLNSLKNALLTFINTGALQNNDTIVTNSRHYSALLQALGEIQKVQYGIDQNLSGDLLAIDIRQALYHFGEITGEITSDDLLGNIFANFCIGK